MHWNEKIDLLKKHYTEEEFFVPHINRKEILRKIETNFISRTKDYYHLNNLNNRFSNWWRDIKNAEVFEIKSSVSVLDKIDALLDEDETYWLAAEFSDGVLIYKAKKKAVLSLITVGRTWTRTFHVIQLKYAFMISFKLEAECLKIKKCGSNKMKGKKE